MKQSRSVPRVGNSLSRASALLLYALTHTALAGGLYLNEFNTPSMGTAGAGQEALADNASTAWVFHNPAGMTRLQGKQLHVSGGLAVTRVEFDADAATPIAGNNGGNAGGVLPGVGAAYVQSLSDDWTFGVSLGALSGAVLDYNNEWAGRYQAQESAIALLAVNPNIAYRINNEWSAGFGVSLAYGVLNFEVAAPQPDGNGQVKLDELDDVAYAFNAGVLHEPQPGTRIGLIYGSEMKVDFSGDLALSPVDLQVDVNTKITLPQFLRLGFYHELNDRFALLGSIGWEDWSVLGNQFIATQRLEGAIPRNWDDTWHYALGLHYRLNPRWLLQAGITYDTNPVDTDDRTADLPVDRQIRYGIGARYQMRNDLTVNSALVYADLGEARIDDSLLSGEYDKNDAFFFTVNANWQW